MRFQSPHVVVVAGRASVHSSVAARGTMEVVSESEQAGTAAQPLLYATVECENAAGWQCIDRQHVALVREGRETCYSEVHSVFSPCHPMQGH